jgi:TP901 family phage tail tape measure protein
LRLKPKTGRGEEGKHTAIRINFDSCGRFILRSRFTRPKGDCLEIAALFARIGADLTGLEKGLGQTESMLMSAGKKMSNLGSDLTRNLSLPLAALGGIAAKSAIELDTEMRNIQSISKQTDAEIAALSDTFLDMSTDMRKTTDTAKNLAAGFYQIQSSGFAGAEAMEVLEKATKAGSAGLASTDVAATALAATLNAYGKGADQAGHISDLLFETVNRGVVTFGELSGSLSNIVGTAAQAGVSFETVSAAIATMSKQGQSGAESTVALNQLILGLIKPSEDLERAIQNLGYSSGQAMLNALGLGGTLQALSAAGYDSTEAMATLFPNVRALRAALALTGEGAQMFVGDLAAMENAAGATDAAFEQQTKSISAQLKNLKNEFTALGIELAQVAVPALMESVGWLKQQAKAFRDLDPEMQKNIVVWTGIAIAAGPALKIIGGLATGIGTLVGWFPKIAAGGIAIATAMSQVGAAFALMAEGQGVFAVATAGVAGLTAALIPVVAAIAAIGVAYNHLIIKTQKTGLEDTANTWSKFFADLTAKGASAATIANEYAKAQQRVNEQMEQGGLIAKLFVDDQEILRQGQAGVAAAILESAVSYTEYAAAMAQAGLASEALGKAQFTAMTGISENIPVAEDYLATLYKTERQAMDAAMAEYQMAQNAKQVADEFRGMHEEVIKFEDGSEKVVLVFGTIAESMGIFADKTYFARDQVSRLMAQFDSAGSGGKKSAFQTLVETYGLAMAQLMSNAKSALTELQNLLEFLEANPQINPNQRIFLPVLEPPGGTGPTGPYIPPPPGEGGGGGEGEGEGGNPNGATLRAGDTFNISINDSQSAAMMMAEIDQRRRMRLSARMGG